MSLILRVVTELSLIVVTYTGDVQNVKLKLGSQSNCGSAFLGQPISWSQNQVQVGINFCLHQKDEFSASKVKFRQASNHCRRVLEAAKFAYANKTRVHYFPETWLW